MLLIYNVQLYDNARCNKHKITCRTDKITQAIKNNLNTETYLSLCSVNVHFCSFVLRNQDCVV